MTSIGGAGDGRYFLGTDERSRLIVTVQLSSLAADMEAGYREGFGAGLDNLAGAAERTMVLQRVIHAPRSIVWGAWVNPDTLPQWWGPEGFSCRTKRIDLRAGGECGVPGHDWCARTARSSRTTISISRSSPRRGSATRCYGARTWPKHADALGLVRGSGCGRRRLRWAWYSSIGCRVPGGEGLRCRGTATANSGQTGTLRRIPLRCCDFPSARIRLVEMGGPGEAARSGRSAAKGRGCHHLKSANDRLWVWRGQLGTAELGAIAAVDWSNDER